MSHDITLKDVRVPTPRRRAEKILAALQRAAYGVFTNADRPDAATLPPGTQIWNSDDKAPQWSDGTAWRDSSGTLT